MCNETQRLQPFINKWAGRSVKELFSKIYINPEFRYDNVYPGNCLVCKNPLSHRQMWPSGRCPRCICEHCYSKIILGTINHQCIISGDPLPFHQVQAQQLNPREVANNIKAGYARDYYTLIACKVLGEDLSFLMDEAYAPRYNQLPHYGDNREDVIDAEYFASRKISNKIKEKFKL